VVKPSMSVRGRCSITANPMKRRASSVRRNWRKETGSAAAVGAKGSKKTSFCHACARRRRTPKKLKPSCSTSIRSVRCRLTGYGSRWGEKRGRSRCRQQGRG
jgi:hypothetical protein